MPLPNRKWSRLTRQEWTRREQKTSKEQWCAHRVQMCRVEMSRRHKQHQHSLEFPRPTAFPYWSLTNGQSLAAGGAFVWHLIGHLLYTTTLHQRCHCSHGIHHISLSITRLIWINQNFIFDPVIADGNHCSPQSISNFQRMSAWPTSLIFIALNICSLTNERNQKHEFMSFPHQNWGKGGGTQWSIQWQGGDLQNIPKATDDDILFTVKPFSFTNANSNSKYI